MCLQVVVLEMSEFGDDQFLFVMDLEELYNSKIGDDKVSVVHDPAPARVSQLVCC